MRFVFYVIATLTLFHICDHLDDIETRLHVINGNIADLYDRPACPVSR